ncbi:hypothetical protein RJT34_01473 [Clitoria ternatea]|uniref:Uncharacterized protein n=1 Tax=Clitoria ternatea TaxID=43366 RepID=A0AAN9KJ07_CLITE
MVSKFSFEERNDPKVAFVTNPFPFGHSFFNQASMAAAYMKKRFLNLPPLHASIYNPSSFLFMHSIIAHLWRLAKLEKKLDSLCISLLDGCSSLGIVEHMLQWKPVPLLFIFGEFTLQFSSSCKMFTLKILMATKEEKTEALHLKSAKEAKFKASNNANRAQHLAPNVTGVPMHLLSIRTFSLSL